jgi:hypothetical protein
MTAAFAFHKFVGWIGDQPKLVAVILKLLYLLTV